MISDERVWLCVQQDAGQFQHVLKLHSNWFVEIVGDCRISTGLLFYERNLACAGDYFGGRKL